MSRSPSGKREREMFVSFSPLVHSPLFIPLRKTMAPHLPHTFWCERGAVASDKVKRCARLAIARGLHDCGRASHCSQPNTLPPLHSFILYNSLCQSHPDVPFLPLHLSFSSFTSRALSSPAAGSCPFWLGLFLFLIFLSIVIAGPRYDDGIGSNLQ